MPGEEADGDEELAQSIRSVIEYTGLSLNEVLDLPCDLFLLFRKNRIVDRLRQTEEGREYLADCERAKQTKPDMEAVHRVMEMLSR